MEIKEEEIIQELMTKDEEVQRLIEEHKKYEKILDEFRLKPVLTAEEEMEKKKIQKLKLAGKDKLYRIIARHKKGVSC